MIGNFLKRNNGILAGCHQVSFAAIEMEFGGDPDLYCIRSDTSGRVEVGNSLMRRWTTGGDRVTFSMCSDDVSYVHCSVRFWVPGPSSVIFSTISIPFRTPLTPTANTASASISYQQSLGAMTAQIFGEIGEGCGDFFAGCNSWTVPPISDPLIFWPPPPQLPRFDMLGNNIFGDFFELANVQPLPRTFIGVIVLSTAATEVIPRSRLNDISVAFIYVTNELGEPPVLPNNAFDLHEKTPSSASTFLSTISLSEFPVLDLAKLCDETSYDSLQNVVDEELAVILETDSLETIEFHKVFFFLFFF